VGVFLATAVIATVTVCAAGFVMIVYGPAGNTPDPLAVAVAQGVTGKSATLLENERQQIILEDADSKKFTVASAPTITSTPAAVVSNDTNAGAPIVASGPPPDPSSAQGIAYNLLPSFGFSTDQFGCLNNIWSRESGWRYNAENASGAYGIPQALPGSKMASAGADWQTDPTTQIKWGLGYIKGTYGTPCDAWSFWQAHGWY
jgi:resuscitation-promoting factor RpfB